MNTHKEISRIFQSDSNRTKIQSLTLARPQKDLDHVSRRQQQRAISDEMLRIALLYGRKTYNRGAVIYTLSDRTLEKTPYLKFTHTLRGLRVICKQGVPYPLVLTAYWHHETKHRARY